MTTHAKKKEDEDEWEKHPFITTHKHTVGRMWGWHPPAFAAFPPLQRRQAEQGLQGAEMP